MLIDLLKRLSKSRWFVWAGLSPIALFVVAGVASGKAWPALGGLAFFGSMFAGIALGGLAASRLNILFFKDNPAIGNRLTTAFQAFGFLSLPAIVGWWANTYLAAGIEMASLREHLFWACAISVVAFCLRPAEPER